MVFSMNFELIFKIELWTIRAQSSRYWSDVVPPLPIPNRVVKRVSADDSIWATVCENRS